MLNVLDAQIISIENSVYIYIYIYKLKIRYQGASFIYDVDRIDLSSYDVYARTCTSIEVIRQTSDIPYKYYK